ncbi:MAG: hypothetical protein EPN26_16460 [Rhodospirillales bacterium]|nr:MAG: hypothetical protein EPN26_16460 [Rhodospirillales bacterium]
MKRILAALILVGGIGLATKAWADCYTPEEVKATQVRQLQTQLMVAALKCSHMPEHAASYNSFVRAFGPQISDSAKVLMGHFKRTSGKDSQRSFDRFITQIANDASSLSINTPDYCETVSQTFQAVQGLRGPELASYAATQINGHTAVPARCN